jgi:prevent-host-death family protein
MAHKPKSRKPAPRSARPKSARKTTGARRSAWTAQDARAHFSEVLDAALEGHPQEIVRSGKDAVMVVSAQDYRKLTKPKQSLRDFFLNSPLNEAFGDSEIPTLRHKERLRDIEFPD